MIDCVKPLTSVDCLEDTTFFIQLYRICLVFKQVAARVISFASCFDFRQPHLSVRLAGSVDHVLVWVYKKRSRSRIKVIFV